MKFTGCLLARGTWVANLPMKASTCETGSSALRRLSSPISTSSGTYFVRIFVFYSQSAPSGIFVNKGSVWSLSWSLATRVQLSGDRAVERRQRAGARGRGPRRHVALPHPPGSERRRHRRRLLLGSQQADGGDLHVRVGTWGAGRSREQRQGLLRWDRDHGIHGKQGKLA